MRDDSLPQLIQEQNGRKRYIQSITLSTSGVLTGLNAKDVYGITVPVGACLVLQGSVDFLYEPRDASATATAVTVASGARPGVYVTANAQEFVMLNGRSAGGASTGTQDVKIDAIGTAAGVLNVFWVS